MIGLTLALACTSGTSADSGDTGTAFPEPVGATGTHLIYSQSPGVTLAELDGTPVETWRWNELVDDGFCDAGCDPQELEIDGDAVVAAYATFGSDFPGGVLRLAPDDAGSLSRDWLLDGLAFPHDVQRLPGTETFVIADTLLHRLLWIDPTTGERVAELGGDHPDWDDYFLPNGLDVIRTQGRTYVLMCTRGSRESMFAIDGHLVLWDTTDPTAPERVWVYPSEGDLSMPHGPILRPHDGGWLLAYAHTQSVAMAGLYAQGSLGLAWTDDIRELPSYWGDGLLPDHLGPLEYHRGVELSADGDLYVAESVDMFQGDTGRLTHATLPQLEPAGLTGAWDEQHSQIAWFTLDDAEVLDTALQNLFQVRLFTPPGAAEPE